MNFVVGDRVRCIANGHLATVEFVFHADPLGPDALRLRLDEPRPRLLLWDKRVIYVHPSGWEKC